MSNNPVAKSKVCSVREAVERGMPVYLPNLLDDWYGWKADGYTKNRIALWCLASEVAHDHDLTLKQADAVVRHTLTSLGVDLRRDY